MRDSDLFVPLAELRPRWSVLGSKAIFLLDFFWSVLFACLFAWFLALLFRFFLRLLISSPEKGGIQVAGIRSLHEYFEDWREPRQTRQGAIVKQLKGRRPILVISIRSQPTVSKAKGRKSTAPRNRAVIGAVIESSRLRLVIGVLESTNVLDSEQTGNQIQKP